VGRSLHELLPRIASLVDVELLSNDHLASPDIGIAEHPLHVPLTSSFTAWLQTAVPRWLRNFDGVFHCPFYGLPFIQPVPMVVTIHDIAFELHPEWYTPDKLLAFRVQARHAVRTARFVLTDTETIREAVIERYRLPAARVRSAPLGPGRAFRPDQPEEKVQRLRRRLGIAGPYLVALGGARRRGLDRAVSSWRRLLEKGVDLQLVVVGGEQPPPQAGLVFAGALTDEDWAYLLVAAEALIYPTEYEGFGMPAVEAIASGTPVVCARVGSLPEVLDGAAEWCNDTGVEAIATGLERLLANPQRHQRLVADGLRRVSEMPGWDACAQTHVDTYQRAIG
jgi:glycosyltransferase involved in cell wall biosynthesis